MKITADKHALRVDFRLAGKQYGVGSPDDAVGFDNAERTSYPFESQDVQLGETFTLPEGAEFVRLVEYKPTPATPVEQAPV